jgi:hypothetical protein
MLRAKLASPLVHLIAALGALPALAVPPPLLAPLSDGQRLPLPQIAGELPSPAGHLGYSLGERFTRHADILGYLRALDAASPRVAMWQYGASYEDRPLVLLAISSADNIARLDELRAARALLDRPHQLARQAREELLRDMPAVVWLGYGVHGNESSSAEAAMAAAYVLAGAQGEGAPDLSRLVVLIDPLLNPDGRERYVNGFVSRRGREANGDPQALEHSEPWPGGRGNHYFVDMNRDWAWATQVETQARVAEMATWEPQVYVDFHEMSSQSTYFFPPPAEPLHPAFGEVTRQWLHAFGRANAAAFDQLGWSYYVGEEFDFFYPAYGDTYPTLRGGIGMTYEVAGGGVAGSVLERKTQGRWQLADRIARHLATSLATVATAAAGDRKLLGDFLRLRERRATEPGPTFVWRADQPEARELARLLARHGLEVDQLRRDEEVEAVPIAGGDARRQRLPAGSWAVSSAQPLGTLAIALLEREAEVPAAFLQRQRERADENLDALFYDVTAWSLPLALNLHAWSTDASLATTPVSAGELTAAYPATATAAAGGRVGFLVPPAGVRGYAFAAAALRRDLPVRVALEGITVGERTFPPGTLFLPRAGREDLAAEVTPLAAIHGVELVPLESSLPTAGIPLGSERVVPLRRPRVAVAAGPGVASTSAGSLWHLLDRQVEVEHSLVDVSALGSLDLSSYTALLLPEGSGYGHWLDEGDAERIGEWVQRGGVLVAIGDAADWLHEHELTTVAARKLDEASQEGDGEGGGAPAGDEERVWDTELFVPGSIVASEMRRHPLTVGVDGAPPMLFWGDRFHAATGDPQQDLLRVRGSDPLLAGVAWQEAREQISGALLMASERRGDGRVVVFTQDPAFRLFWRGTMPLLLNALLLAPSV